MVSALLILLGVFLGLVTFSNRFTTIIPQFGGTYREGIVGSPRFINPVLANSDADRDLTDLVYSGLARIDRNGTIIPDLAESWEITPDGKTYTVLLKDKIVFHDNKPVTSEDVAFTIFKIQDPTLKSPLRVAWNGVRVGTPDDRTIVFSLEKPYAGFLNQLVVGILPKHLWSSIETDAWTMSELNTEPIGSGPFRVTSVSRSRIGVPETFTLKRFHRFALGAPYLKTFIIKCFQNKTDAYHAFQDRSIDAIAAVDSEYVSSLKKKATIVTAPLPRVFGIFFNASQNKIFTEQSVITALNIAIDKKELIDGVFNGFAHPLNGPLPQSIEELSGDSATKQALAAKNLDAAGWKLNPTTNIREKIIGKEKQTLSFSLSTANTPELEASARFIAEQYAKIGVSVEVKVFEIGTLNEQVIRTRNFQALLFGEIIKHDTDVYAFWDSSQRTDPGLNITGYSNKNTDTILAAAIKETDRTKRFILYKKLQQELARTAPVAFLYSPDMIYLIDHSFKNIIVPPITTSNNRFSLAYQWYTRTDHVWKFFTK